ncbi:MAG: thiamine diphosphokinase [Ignavibacteriales bacterium]|nr:thiamine diphosphokinase [Ignavibacteriales bacterium]
MNRPACPLPVSLASPRRMQRGESAGRRALILANGHPPTKRLVKTLKNMSAIFVCADGGANAAARMSLTPDLIIGDLDSIAHETKKKFSRVQTKHIAEQNSTDLEKAIRWLLQRGYREIVVAGALGGRPDHLLGNFSALVKFSGRASIRFVDDREEVCSVGKQFAATLNVGETISLLPLNRCEGITTKGFKWDLKNQVLELGYRESTSNVAVANVATIRVRKGDLLLYRRIGKSNATYSAARK